MKRQPTMASTAADALQSLSVYGKPVPRFDLTIETSPALMLPFAFISDRKFV